MNKMNEENIIKSANLIFKYRLNNKEIKKIPKNLVPNNIQDAYKIQNKLSNELLNLNNNYLIGKKIGCTNQEAQKQLDITEPFYGNLFSKFSSTSGCELLSKNFSNPYIEPEFSFKLNQDINISNAPFTLNEVKKFVEHVVASIEIVDFRFKDDLKNIGINKLIANNGASEFWIKGKKTIKLDNLDLNNHEVKVFINSKLIEKGNSSKVLENPMNSFLWLINNLSKKGECLLKNYYISTGTCTKAIPVSSNSEIKVNFGTLGNIDFKYI
tara:strand:+ start:134 stop:940 length:807 start_codon:yes stop_codon:yes gene_type:complete